MENSQGVCELTSTLRHLNLIVGGTLGLIATGYVLAGVVFCDIKNIARTALAAQPKGASSKIS